MLVGEAVTFAPVEALKPVAGLHEKLVAPVALRVADPPAQIVPAPVTVTAGSGLTVTTIEAVLEQLLPFVPVMVYVVVAIGFAVTEAPFVELNPVAGLHKYVEAPEAVRVVELPPHIVAIPVILTVGREFTVTEAIVEFAAVQTPLVTTAL